MVTAGKSAAIRILVPTIDRFSCFDAQRLNVIQVLKAVQSLSF
mgnify:CR=1 FL=1